MSGIFEQHLISFAVEGREIPVSLSSFRNLSIISNVSQSLPTLQFTYNDPANHLINNPLVDAAKVAIVLHSNVASDPEQPLEFTFRTTGAEYQPSGNRWIVRSAGVFDKMQYLNKIQKMPVNGNSGDALRQVAQGGGFSKFNIPQAGSDKMWWRPKNQMQKIANFASMIATHGRIDDKSVMSIGVGDSGTFHYRNIAKLAESGGGRTVTEFDRYNPSRGDIPLLAWSVKSMGGATNMLTGYGSQVIQEKLTGSADVISSVLTPMLGGALNMSSAAQKGIGDVSRIFAGTSIGNHHDNYYQAKEQNVRGQQQLQSTRIEFMTNMASGLDIYDKVDFKPHNPITNDPMELFSGSYIVTSKTRYFEGARYYREKYTICSNNFGGSEGQVGYSKK